MSNFLRQFREQLLNGEHDVTMDMAIQHFREAHDPWQEFFQYLLVLCYRRSENLFLIECLLEAFKRWKTQYGATVDTPPFHEKLFLYHLPSSVLRSFCDLFPMQRENLIPLIRKALPNGPIDKHLLNIIVSFDFQLEFQPHEVLLPLILYLKDHLIHVYMNNNPNLERYVLDLLNHLYENGGQDMRRILTIEYNVHDQNFINKKALKKLAVRLWNSIGHRCSDLYPNLATLQDRSTLGYLMGIKYNVPLNERTMSDECWNESIEDVVNGNRELAQYCLELLAENGDTSALDYWFNRFQSLQLVRPASNRTYLRRTPANPYPDPISTNNSSQRNEYYQVPWNRIAIRFVDSMTSYDRLLNRLFNGKNPNEELIVGFDCEWKPIYRNDPSARQRISIMTIAFPDEVFLVDLLHFFHTCDDEKIQERLANRLFDDERMTVLCYGFSSDMNMLTCSYPVFQRALSSGTTLLDLAMVQTELVQKQLVQFPFQAMETGPASKDKGLSELVRLCFGKRLDKSEQCSNWERRPLRDAQRFYAATDAYCLLDLYRFIRDELRQSSDYLRSFRGRKPNKSTESKATKNGEDFSHRMENSSI